MLIKLKTNKYSWLLLLLMVGFSFHLSAHETKRDTKQETFDFSDLSCWDVMLLNEEERALALTLVYGYQAGVDNKKIHSGEKIEKTLSSTSQLCEENPDMKILAAISKAGH